MGAREDLGWQQLATERKKVIDRQETQLTALRADREDLQKQIKDLRAKLRDLNRQLEWLRNKYPEIRPNREAV